MRLQSADAVGFLCAETSESESRTLPPEVRARRRGQPLPGRKCCITRGNTGIRTPSSLPESSSLLAEWVLKGGPQKCSAHAKVCVSALGFKPVILEGQRRMTLFYFPNPDEPCGSVGCYLQKGNVCWECPGGGDSVEILIWIEDVKKDFLCMFIICLWLSVGVAAVILYGDTPRNRFKHSDFKSVFMSSGHLCMSLVIFFLVHSQEIICQ